MSTDRPTDRITDRITVLGATGKVGGHVVRRALARGLQVSALVRDPARLPSDLTGQPALRVVRGTLDDRAAVARALDGVSAVISAVGVRYRGGNPMRGLDGPADVVPTAVASVLAAAPGRPRLVLLSAYGTGETRSALPGVVRLVIRLSALRHSYAALEEAERLALAGPLPVSVVRPVTLSDAPATGRDLAAISTPPTGSSKVSREDVAEVLLAEALRDQGSERVVLSAQ